MVFHLDFRQFFCESFPAPASYGENFSWCGFAFVRFGRIMNIIIILNALCMCFDIYPPYELGQKAQGKVQGNGSMEAVWNVFWKRLSMNPRISVVSVPDFLTCHSREGFLELMYFMPNFLCQRYISLWRRIHIHLLSFCSYSVNYSKYH